MSTEGDSYTTDEGWHQIENNGPKLYVKTWKPVGEVKARMVLVHGFSDHCNTYSSLIVDLTSYGIEVFGFDQRGWGRSVLKPSQRGLTGPTPTVLSDISSILRRFSGESLPLFLFGHSMGGGEILTYASLFNPSHEHSPYYSAALVKDVPHIRGFIADAPFFVLDPYSRPFRATVVLGRLVAKLAPNGHMYQKLKPELLSRDPKVCEEYETDELRHKYGTFEGLAGMLSRGEELAELKTRVEESEGGQRSVWVAHGTKDLICDFSAVKNWVENGCTVKDKTMRSFDGWYHILHAEPGEDKKLFSSELANWILARC